MAFEVESAGNERLNYTFVHICVDKMQRPRDKRSMKQLKLLKNEPKAYGGDLLKTRKGRVGGRPLDTKNTMHLILKSSKAKGAWSFWLPKNKEAIQKIIAKFSKKYGIKTHSMANVGNHIHFQIKLQNRHTYKPFIRAITAAIAMAVTGKNRWNKDGQKEKFWDTRPFTRVVVGFRNFLNLKDYININRMEGFGMPRAQAKFFLSWNDLLFTKSASTA